MFKIKIQTDNAAFVDDKQGELARILRDVADRLERGFSGGVILDSNGNKVGKFSLE